MSKPTHYRPAGGRPRCAIYRDSTYRGKLEILLDKSRLTTDVARATCSFCCRYIAQTVHGGRA